MAMAMAMEFLLQWGKRHGGGGAGHAVVTAGRVVVVDVVHEMGMRVFRLRRWRCGSRHGELNMVSLAMAMVVAMAMAMAMAMVTVAVTVVV